MFVNLKAIGWYFFKSIKFLANITNIIACPYPAIASIVPAKEMELKNGLSSKG